MQVDPRGILASQPSLSNELQVPMRKPALAALSKDLDLVPSTNIVACNTPYPLTPVPEESSSFWPLWALHTGETHTHIFTQTVIHINTNLLKIKLLRAST